MWWHTVTRVGKWRGNWRMEWVASTLHTTSEHGVSSITTTDAHTSAASSRLNWRPPADLNGLVRFAERRNLVSARVPSHFKRSLTTWGNCVIRILMICIPHQILFGWYAQQKMRWARHVAHMGERRGAYRVLVGKPEGKRQLWRRKGRWEDNIKICLQEIGWQAWTGLIWLRTGTGDGLLWTRWWNFGLHKMQGSSWLAEKLLVGNSLVS